MICQHEVSEPVFVNGVKVARICTSCFGQLPANWGCPSCEWVAQVSFGVAEPVGQSCVERCPRHNRSGW